MAVTSNGWYKTYNGNYVKKEYTTESKPSSTPTPKPKSTTAEETERATEAAHDEPSSDGNTCTITFYGPQPNGDGTYNNSTATGTTCVEGRTCAADWSIYPAGTVIYIENDPLGGDGYYTVEDRGPGVKGYHIDIYADDGESGNHRTCSRTVYEV
ncbi:MAG: 3D domain-containing protein [Saccharofermentans sp.]|nr:3D domain-containing protein [Saccharofermentans sp.]